MIKSRNSEDHLSKDMILTKIREIDIFSYYCSSFKELGVKFCSELREDNAPSVSIIEWKGKLLYKDFGYPEHTFDCFSYVMVAQNYHIEFSYYYRLSFVATSGRLFAFCKSSRADSRTINQRIELFVLFALKNIFDHFSTVKCSCVTLKSF